MEIKRYKSLDWILIPESSIYTKNRQRHNNVFKNVASIAVIANQPGLWAVRSGYKHSLPFDMYVTKSGQAIAQTGQVLEATGLAKGSSQV